MSSAPHNFSWVDQGKVAGLALPRYPAEYRYLLENGIKHLVSLTERRPPNHDSCPELTQHHLKITDFMPPSPAQVDNFLSIVETANAKGEVWRFSTAFGTVNEWKFANIASMADHLKKCKFNTIARREEAIPLPCMCFTRELTKEGRCLRSVLKPVA